MSGDALFIGVDLGTSGVKAVAVGVGGEVAARAHARHPTARPEPGAAEQSPADWWSGVESCVARLRQGGAPAERWVAVGVTGMIPALVLADRDGAPVAPAVTWEDGRAAPDGDALRDAVGAEQLYRRTGQWVDGRYLLPMFLRLARVAPQAARRARWLLGAKDWLFWRLTGEPATDPSTASGFGCFGLAQGAWLDDVAEAAGRVCGALHNDPGTCVIVQGAADLPVSPDRSGLRLPPILPSTDTRPLSGDAAERLGLPAGLPVCVGGADSVLGCLGLGVTLPGDVAYVAGTSTVILGVADRFVPDASHRYLVTPLAGLEGWGFEMDLLTTGSAFRWLAGLLGDAGDEEGLMAMAGGVEPGAAGLSFLPYLAPGEQGALWDPTLSGTLFGLALGHGRTDVARALVDGVLLESRRCLAVLEEAGLPRGGVHIAGGSGADPVFRQQLADASRRRVVFGADGETDHSAIGAAALAAVATGHGRLPAAPTARLQTLEPRKAESARWDALWGRHEAALRAVRGAGGVLG